MTFVFSCEIYLLRLPITSLICLGHQFLFFCVRYSTSMTHDHVICRAQSRFQTSLRLPATNHEVLGSIPTPAPTGGGLFFADLLQWGKQRKVSCREPGVPDPWGFDTDPDPWKKVCVCFCAMKSLAVFYLNDTDYFSATHTICFLSFLCSSFLLYTCWSSEVFCPSAQQTVVVKVGF